MTSTLQSMGQLQGMPDTVKEKADGCGLKSNIWSVTRERLPRLSRSPARTYPIHAAGCYWIKEGDKEKFLPLPENAVFIPYDTL